MQLAPPIQGAHRRGSGRSVLDYLLEDHAVVPPDRGIFLSKTWRMHPDLCCFVSDAVYDSALHSEAGCANQRLVLGPGAHRALKPTGLSFVPVVHEGCRQKSEGRRPRRAPASTVSSPNAVVDRRGRERKIELVAASSRQHVFASGSSADSARAEIPDGTACGPYGVAQWPRLPTLEGRDLYALALTAHLRTRLPNRTGNATL